MFYFVSLTLFNICDCFRTFFTLSRVNINEKEKEKRAYFHVMLSITSSVLIVNGRRLLPL